MATLNDEMVDFWKKFGTLLNSGVPLMQSLDVIAAEVSFTEVKEIIDEVKKGIMSGETMYQAFARYPKYFPSSLLTMIKAGEATGNLDKVSLKIADAYKDGTFKVMVPLGRQVVEKLEKTKPEEKDIDIVRIINLLFIDAFKNRVSDIHLEKMRTKMRIRYRIDGVLKEIASPPPLEKYDAMVRRIKIMADMNVAERRLPQDGRIRFCIDKREFDLRVSISPCLHGESVVMRILDKALFKAAFELEHLGFSGENLKTLTNWYKKPNGIIIISGPTGCGKTTTMYGIINKLNNESVKISTIEDPVEYDIEGVNQMGVNPRIGLTFANALRSILRQDPDIIMVGETRDLETAQLEIQAALTGHLVISTLHTNNATAAVIRLLDIGLEPFLINSSLVGIVSQRLVRKICEDCKEEYTPDSWVLEMLKDRKKVKLFRGRGCDKCHNFGYRGRIGIHELFELNDTVRKLILNKIGAEELRKTAIEQGMKTLKEDGIEKALQGITTLEEVVRVC